LTQITDYPNAAHTEFEVTTDKDTALSMRFRIPEWAGSKTSLSVNGQRAQSDLTPGRFASLKRTWKNGDRIMLEFDTPLKLESVDPEHPNLVALQNGSLSLFAIVPGDHRLKRSDLLSARQLSSGSSDWEVNTDSGKIAFKPFSSIGDEQYRLYQEVVA
jgi:hypothetical protein